MSRAPVIDRDVDLMWNAMQKNSKPERRASFPRCTSSCVLDMLYPIILAMRPDTCRASIVSQHEDVIIRYVWEGSR